MDKTQLKQELIVLHEELGRVVSQHEQLDGNLIQALRQVAVDIDRVLKEHESATAISPARVSGKPVVDETGVSNPSPAVSPQTLEELAEQFSVDHPETAAVLSRLGYLLSNLGI
ncbi:MAG: DUF4404 family protein [Planctomycetaceae bacterium]|nr:DUF4404 family protein [Planctomycetaceae bacterium]